MPRKAAGRADVIPCLGWREWVTLPDLGGCLVKVKVDSGARTSALHAYDIKQTAVNGSKRVRFTLFPEQRSKRVKITAEAELIGERFVRSSLGHLSLRPVIRTSLQLGPQAWPIELTLVDRDVMGFRMLLGRQAIANRYLVDPGQSFLLGRRPSPPPLAAGKS